MKYKPIIIVAGIFVVAIGIFVTAFLVASSDPSPSSSEITEDTIAKPSSPNNTEPNNSNPDADFHDHTDDHDHGEEFSPVTLQSMTTNATQAVAAYVRQTLTETAEERKERLSPYFHPASTVPGGPAPITSTGYSTDSISTLETSWTPTSDPAAVGVIVYIRLRVNASFDSFYQNQTWLAELLPQPDGGWLTNAITPIDLPYVETES